ncbi:MAG: FIST N-terminal domain-containing protein [Thermoguttaceae bacterium]
MKRSNLIATLLAAAVLTTMTFGDCGTCDAKPALVSGNGYSDLKDAKQAGAEAAAKAKAKLGKTDAKLVLVFDQVPANPEAKAQMLEGIGSVFDASIVYGCSSYAPITQDSNTGIVAVLAIGGDIEVVPAVANLEGGHAGCGTRIGQSLKAGGVSQADGTLVMLFGSCHVNKNDALVKGVCGVLGEKFPVAGAAASKGEFVYYQGKVTKEKSNVGIAIKGDFKCSFAAGNAPGNDKEAVIAVAGKAAIQAVGDDKPLLTFAFDCGGRRGQMGGEIDRELALIKGAIGDTPLFGFYGSGETGPKDNDSAPQGVGYHVFICVISGK